MPLILLMNFADPEVCEDLPASAWRHECFFFAADNTDNPFEARWAMCERTRPDERVMLGYRRAWARHQETP